MTKTYIAGPMTGIDEYNRPAFNAAAAALRAQGRDVFNPAENGLPDTAAWEEHMRVDIRALMDCDVIHMLPGWCESRGAQIEWLLAYKLGMAIEGAAV